MNKKLILAIIVVLIIAGAVVAGIFLTRQQQDIRTSADPATTLTITPPTGTTVELGSEIVANIEINTNENAVVIADMVITFDPTRLEAQSVVPGTFFANPQEEGPTIDNNIGRIEYAVYIPVGAVARQGTGTVASITFSTTDIGDANIGFGPETIVGAFEEENNVLIDSEGTSITIIPSEDEPGEQTATPTATPEGDDDGTTSPTPTSTATPTPTSSSGGNGGGSTDDTGGSGGVGGASPTATPRPTSTSQAGATTPPQTLPESGFGTPTIIAVVVGMILVLGSLIFAL